jgi:hypothetical protein
VATYCLRVREDSDVAVRVTLRVLAMRLAVPPGFLVSLALVGFVTGLTADSLLVPLVCGVGAVLLGLAMRFQLWLRSDTLIVRQWFRTRHYPAHLIQRFYVIEREAKDLPGLWIAFVDPRRFPVKLQASVCLPRASRTALRRDLATWARAHSISFEVPEDPTLMWAASKT